MSRALSMLALAHLSMAWLASGCVEEIQGEDHPTSGLHFPIGIAADPSGEHVYVVSSNFDLAYLGGNVVAIDLETHRTVPGLAVQIKSFGGDIAVLERDGKARRLFVTTREEETLTWIEVCRKTDEACTNRVPEAERASLPEAWLHCADAVDPGSAHTCNGMWVFGGDEADMNAGEDPFGVAVQPARDGAPGHVFTVAFDGTFSAFRLDAEGNPTTGENVAVGLEQLGLSGGSYDVAVHPLASRVYATTKFGAWVQNVSVEDIAVPQSGSAEGGGTAAPELAYNLTIEPSVGVANPTAGRDFGRAMAFSSDGSMAFVAYRTPPSLLVIDTSIDSAGEPANRLLHTIPLGDGPADVAVAPSGEDAAELVYVTLYSSDALAVVDPRRMEVVERIDMGDGPFAIAVARHKGNLRAYVTLFEDMKVGVVELDRASYWYHREIARIP